VAPQAVTHTRRIREARRLRGRPDAGWRAAAATARPVQQSALDRSLALAAAMDARGFGRTREVPTRDRRATAALVLTGLTAATVGGYALLDATTPGWQGLGALVGGTLVAVAGLARAGRRSVRTVYRPDPWRAPEWMTVALGLSATAVTVLVATVVGGTESGLTPSLYPLAWPTLPLLPWLMVLAASLPAFLTPPPVRADGANLPAGPGLRRGAAPAAAVEQVAA
jgi:energy-coupling factor transport system permease protein